MIASVVEEHANYAERRDERAVLVNVLVDRCHTVEVLEAVQRLRLILLDHVDAVVTSLATLAILSQLVAAVILRRVTVILSLAR